MSTDEEKYKKDLEDAGVDLPDLEDDKGETPNTEDDPDKDPDADKSDTDSQDEVDPDGSDDVDETDDDQDDEDDEPSGTKDKKRSIYDDLKGKKKDLREEKERREKAEKERDDALEELAKYKSGTREEKQEDIAALDAFAEETGLPVETLKKMKDVFTKDVKVLDDQTVQDLKEFREYKEKQALQSERAAFEEEFNESLPALKELFPKASDEDMKAMKKELDKLAHSEGWNDKELDYIAYKNQKKLSALISPKKRGLESKNPIDGQETSNEFDPNADLSSMSAKERAAWEEKYNKATSSGNGLATGADGKKFIV